MISYRGARKHLIDFLQKRMGEYQEKVADKIILKRINTDIDSDRYLDKFEREEFNKIQ